MDKDGKIIINPQFNEAFPFNGSDLAAVKSGNKYGYINKEGKIMINPQFDLAFPFNGKLAMVVSSSKLGFIDKDGKYAINPQFDGTSEDFAMYLMRGETSYSSVKTDFFNIDLIKSRLELLSPEGFKSNSSMGDVLKKYKKSQDDIGKYSTEHKMIDSERISNDASLDFYVLGEPWSRDRYYEPWKFDDGQKPAAFAYIVKLKGKGHGKADAVMSEIETLVTDLKKDETESSESESIYKNNKRVLRIYTRGQEVAVVVNYLETEDINLDNDTIAESEHESSVEDEDFYPDDVYRISDLDGYSNLRDKPNGAIIRKVLESEEFSVIGNENKHEKVQLADGTIGFIHESRVVSSVNYKVRLKSGVADVNVRDNYGVSKTKVIKQISAPMTLTVIKEYSLDNNGEMENWIYLKEVKGWILSDFTSN